MVNILFFFSFFFFVFFCLITKTGVTASVNIFGINENYFNLKTITRWKKESGNRWSVESLSKTVLYGSTFQREINIFFLFFVLTIEMFWQHSRFQKWSWCTPGGMMSNFHYSARKHGHLISISIWTISQYMTENHFGKCTLNTTNRDEKQKKEKKTKFSFQTDILPFERIFTTFKTE